MKWRLIQKDKVTQPIGGEYSDWKEQIASECFNQCVYCSIHEANWGGIDHYHIDHFRPKSRKEFEHLLNDITNLYYACPVCNRFKHADWPGEPDLDTVSYPDPSKTDYSTLFDLDLTSFKIIGKYIASRYLANRLYLNRPQLIYERREHHLQGMRSTLISDINELLRDCEDLEILKRYVSIISAIQLHLDSRTNIRPYKLAEIRKP